MKRRGFILSAITVAVTLPIVYYFKRNKWKHTFTLVQPDTLSIFCNEKAIRDIGMVYRNNVPLENTKQKLIDLLITDNENKNLKLSDNSLIIKNIERMIHANFLTDKTLIINGWVLSVTEARQCALFSMS
jgi:hypothetical protein